MHSFPLFGKKMFPSLIKHSPWAYSTPTLLIFPHNNSMLSLTLLFSFVYTRCWQSTPPSKLSSAIPYHKISLQAYKEIVVTFFFFDHYKGRQARGHLCEYLFPNHNRDSATFKKSAGISTFRTVRELLCNTLLYNRWQIKIELAWRDFTKLISNTLVMGVPERFQSIFECLAHEPRISALFSKFSNSNQ